ncbi:MAG TPA: 50S ribosomal protein L29 [Acidobacteriota bacterium]|nr:50S ribosomal protein L29 [Acidobacteriota bacterium]
MKASKYREMTTDQLEGEVQELSQQLFRLRFQKATGQLENAQKIREIRKDLARVRTVLTEKKKGAAA